MTDEFVKREDVAEGARKQMRLDNYEQRGQVRKKQARMGLRDGDRAGTQLGLGMFPYCRDVTCL